MTYRQKKPYQDMLTRLVDDLRSKKTLCHVEDYPGVGLEELNNHVKKLGPLENPLFGEQPASFIDEGRFIPYRAISYGNVLVAYEIGRQLGNWAECSGGRATSSPGAFIFGTDVRMPDVAYTPHDADRGLSTESTWTYQGEPFVPTFVVEIDKLSGRGSKDLDRKMRNEYFQNCVKLGWLVDPRPDCHAMYVYYLDNDNQVQCSANSAWRDLDGGDVLPGFRITSTSLDRVLNQDSGSSSEEEVDLTCPLHECEQQFTAASILTAHLEWHRSERADQKYLAKQNL